MRLRLSREQVVIPLMLLLLVVVMALTNGCESFKNTETPQVNLATGYILLSQVRLMAADAVKTKVISADEARNILSLTDTARQTLDVARDAYFGGSKDAANKGLEIAGLIMQQIRNDLEARIAAKKGVK